MKNAPKLSKIQSILALLVLTLLSTPSYAQDTLKLNGANHENLKRIGETNVWVDYSDSYLLPSSQNPSLLIDMQTSGFLMLEEKPIALSEYITNVRALTRYRDTLLNIPIQIAGFKGSLMKGVTGRGEAAEIFWLMYFGDESRVYDWKGGYLVSNDEILSEQILSILRSVRWIEGDFFEDYPYAFDTGLDGFTFEKIDIPNAVIIKKYEGADSLNATVFYSVGEEFFTLQLAEDLKSGLSIPFEEGVDFKYDIYKAKKQNEYFLMLEGRLRKGDEEIGMIVIGSTREFMEREIKELMKTFRFK